MASGASVEVVSAGLADSGLSEGVADYRARRPAGLRSEAGCHFGEVGDEAPVTLQKNECLADELVEPIIPLGPGDTR